MSAASSWREAGHVLTFSNISLSNFVIHEDYTYRAHDGQMNIEVALTSKTDLHRLARRFVRIAELEKIARLKAKHGTDEIRGE